ncbi:helix-turn-helix transcriptional regulator [Methylobacterium hispanicum]|uniref:helix-turn-helix transcriptional regulator n=1 Tax=Methylobacterium hispanicum TaxID=270350 RepID=UPI002F35B4C4
MNDRLIRRAEAASFLGIGVSTLDRMIASGRMPQPIKMSPRVVGWRESVLQSLLDEREAQACAQK